MQAVLANPVICWLIAGALLIIIEALTAPGLGLFLIGIGAFGTALGIEAGWIAADALAAQCACCFIVTGIVAALLWKPLKRFRLQGQPHPAIELNNMVGQTAVVAAGGLTQGRPGQVSWSGTLMTAELVHADAAIVLPEGAQVLIRSVSGTTLHVAPK